MTRRASRTKKVSYVLQVTCDKTSPDNETDFLNRVRGALVNNGVFLESNPPRVSVIRRVEEYISVKDKA